MLNTTYVKLLFIYFQTHLVKVIGQFFTSFKDGKLRFINGIICSEAWPK